jgi:hypothetical protein
VTLQFFDNDVVIGENADVAGYRYRFLRDISGFKLGVMQ